jgi:hypothetical protein
MIYYVLSTYIIAAILFTYAKKWKQYGLAFYWLSPITLPIALVWGVAIAIKRVKDKEGD